MARASVEVLQNRGGKWYWRAKAGNGEITSVSQPYAYKRNAARAGRKEAAQRKCQLVVKPPRNKRCSSP